MNLLELNRIFSGNYEGCQESKKGLVTVNKDEVQEFFSLFTVNPEIKTVFDGTENYMQFYEHFPWIKKCFPVNKAKELFYAAKCEMIYEDVPPTVVFLLRKALATFEYKYVNLAVSRVERKMLEPYLKTNILEDGTVYKDVIDNIVGTSSKLLTPAVPCVDVEGVSELYVPNIDAVALVPTDMLEGITDLEDFRSVEYDKVFGLMIKGQIIRTMGGRTGLTKNDLDLRGCL